MDCICEQLRANGVSVGRATVYRFLERLQTEGCVVKCKSAAESRAEYRYLPERPADAASADSTPETDSAGKLCCVDCGRIYPLHCTQLEGFSRHVFNEHGFILAPEKTVLYGRCAQCAKISPKEEHHHET